MKKNETFVWGWGLGDAPRFVISFALERSLSYFITCTGMHVAPTDVRVQLLLKECLWLQLEGPAVGPSHQQQIRLVGEELLYKVPRVSHLWCKMFSLKSLRRDQWIDWICDRTCRTHSIHLPCMIFWHFVWSFVLYERPILGWWS